ncbi:MAG: nucleoside deaminase [bacterium]|nr:nucleoside deaminase [bacterium]
MTPDELMAEACRLGEQSARSGWGGPFGAVIASEGEIVARGQNVVLLTGDITAHGEVSAIRKAVSVLNPYAPSIAESERNHSTLALVPKEPGSDDVVPARSRMLLGMELYTSGFPCPMCMGAIYWARIGKVYFACSAEDTREIGFDDAFQYEDFARPLSDRRIPIEQLGREDGLAAYRAWSAKPDRHPY